VLILYCMKVVKEGKVVLPKMGLLNMGEEGEEDRVEEL
jgi:hypothetical protein